MSRRAFTLLELVISIAIGMALIAAAWGVFHQAKSATDRALKRIGMHRQAAVIMQAMQQDMGLSGPLTALFCRSSTSTSGTDRSDVLELLFMSTQAPLLAPANQDCHREDHHWVRWRFTRTWSQRNGRWSVLSTALKRSVSTPTRLWTGLGGATYANIPRPRRDALSNRMGIDAIATLDLSSYGSTPTADIGDLTDLDNNESLVSEMLSDFTVSWLDASGGVVRVSSETPADVRIDGLYTDLVGPPGNDGGTQLDRRPRLFRISFALADPGMGLTQVFGLSVSAPGLAPSCKPTM